MGVCCPTCGAPAPAPTQAARNSVQLKPGARPPSSLVTDPNALLSLTPHRETDTHTAMARGLAEYLGQQSIDVGGRKLQLTTYTTWAEPEDAIRYPAAAITADAGVYDRSFTPSVEKSFANNVQLMAFSEFSQELQVEIWATDPRERSYLVAMVEEALNPVDWMYGMRLVLPFYHSTSATYELISSQYIDSSEDALAKYRRAQFTVRANMTAFRLLNFPTARAQFTLEISDVVDDNGEIVILASTS